MRATRGGIISTKLAEQHEHGTHLGSHSPRPLALDNVDPVIEQVACLLRLERDERVGGDAELESG